MLFHSCVGCTVIKAFHQLRHFTQSHKLGWIQGTVEGQCVFCHLLVLNIWSENDYEFMFLCYHRITLYVYLHLFFVWGGVQEICLVKSLKNLWKVTKSTRKSWSSVRWTNSLVERKSVLVQTCCEWCSWMTCGLQWTLQLIARKQTEGRWGDIDGHRGSDEVLKLWNDVRSCNMMGPIYLRKESSLIAIYPKPYFIPRHIFKLF